MNPRLTKILLGMGFVLIGVYGLFAARSLISGPQIDITFPLDNVYSTPLGYVDVEIQTKLVEQLYINDTLTLVSSEGNQTERIYLASGLQVVTFKGVDIHGKETQTNLYLTRTELPAELPQNTASTTSSTAPI